MSRNERTPRTLAETTFSTGYPRATFEARESARYILFVLWLLLMICGLSLVAQYFGG